MMTDPIADLLTRIRNAVRIERPFVDVPTSKVKVAIVEALKREGYIWDHEIIEEAPQNILRISLKYGPNGEKVIQHIERVSKPGRRQFCQHTELPEVLQGLGVCILSTNQGVISNREAKAKGIGGEVICKVW